jgi:hypothetical protein
MCVLLFGSVKQPTMAVTLFVGVMRRLGESVMPKSLWALRAERSVGCTASGRSP